MDTHVATYRIAVGTVDGQNVTEHFGRSKQFRVIEVDQDSDEEKALADIEVLHSEDCSHGHDQQMLEAKIQALLDWNVTARFSNAPSHAPRYSSPTCLTAACCPAI